MSEAYHRCDAGLCSRSRDDDDPPGSDQVCILTLQPVVIPVLLAAELPMREENTASFSLDEE